METWTPLQLYSCAFATAAVGGLGALFRSDKPLTVRTVIGETLFHGCSGAGLGAIGHEFWWRARPGTVVGVSALYGAGLFSFAEIKAMLLRTLHSAPPESHDESNS